MDLRILSPDFEHVDLTQTSYGGKLKVDKRMFEILTGVFAFLMLITLLMSIYKSAAFVDVSRRGRSVLDECC